MVRSVLGFKRRRTNTISHKVGDVINSVSTLKWQWPEHIARREDDRCDTVVLECGVQGTDSDGHQTDRTEASEKSPRSQWAKHRTRSLHVENSSTKYLPQSAS